MERETRIELATNSLEGCDSTIELLPRNGESDTIVARGWSADAPYTVSRTLNSSFQRRPSRATHQSCSMPVSVTTVSNETGTTSDDAFGSESDSLPSGESSSRSSPKSSIERRRRVVLARRPSRRSGTRRARRRSGRTRDPGCAGRCLLPCRTAPPSSALSGAGSRERRAWPISMPT